MQEPTSGSLAIVVLCRDDGRALAATLASILEQTSRPTAVVVADRASSDPFTRHALARLQDAQVVDCEAAAPAAWNDGIAATSAELVALLAAGDRLVPSYVERTRAEFADNPHAGFCASVGRRSADGRALDLAALLEPIAATTPVVIRRSAWESVRGFDLACPGNGLLDLQLRLSVAGFHGIPAPTAPDGARLVEPPPHHRGELEWFYRKHETLVTVRFDETLLARERALQRQRERLEALNSRNDRLRRELDALNDEIAVAAAALQPLGAAPLDFGDLRRTTPISPVWGLDRGIPLDRYYIADFLDRHRADITGHVLEVKDPGYTTMFDDGRVTRSEVLDILPSNPRATLIGDLAGSEGIGNDRFDCFILTQTLGLIHDVQKAVANAIGALKPGGVLLCTLPASGRISYEPPGLDGDHWRFTEASIRELFARVLPIDAFDIVGYGNVMSCTAFLYGLAPHELTQQELDAVDPYFPVVYGVRAVKPSGS